ncbi:MAG: CAP domain-containing protein [Gemmatimonadetes bacterium]|nr:CAP domain-containing protein [Gemmatimonadota bacterium]
MVYPTGWNELPDIAWLVIAIGAAALLAAMMSRKTRRFMVLAILVLGGIYVARSPGAKAWLSDRVDLVGARLKGRAAPGNPDPTTAAIERHIHREINRQRSDHGLAPLRYDDATAAVARAHSRDMGHREYFAHESPDGRRASDRMAGLVERCNGHATGENIFWATFGVGEERGVVQRAVEGWMESPGHRENILRRKFQITGVGVATVNERMYVTQNFWRCGAS